MTDPEGGLPEGARRLFAHYHGQEEDGAALDLQRDRSLVLARLLEDGDSDDLAWLFREIPGGEVAEWFERHGGRQLSMRSRELWRVVLGREPGPAAPGTDALWPL